MKINFTIRPITPLRRLLAEYHGICERILDEHEIDAVFGPTEKEFRGAAVQRLFKIHHLRDTRAGVGFGHARVAGNRPLMTQSGHCVSLRYRGFLGTFACRGAKGA